MTFMLEKNRLGAGLRVYFRPEKKIITRDGIIHVWSMAYACENPDCDTQALRINLLKLRCLASETLGTYR